MTCNEKYTYREKDRAERWRRMSSVIQDEYHEYFGRIISLLSSKIRLWSNEIAANGTKWRGTARDGMLGMITKETSMYRSIAKINQILYYSMIGDIFLVINGILYIVQLFCPFIRKIHDNEIKLHWTSLGRIVNER